MISKTMIFRATFYVALFEGSIFSLATLPTAHVVGY
jgi:hypothetical protein